MTEKHKIKFQRFALKTRTKATGIISNINNTRNRNDMLGQATCQLGESNSFNMQLNESQPISTCRRMVRQASENSIKQQT